jgi:hypothetical protein
MEMNCNPDNPMALPLTRAEEIRLWGDEQASEAAEQRTRDVLLLDKDAITELEIFEYQVESDALNAALKVAANYRSSDQAIADAMRAVIAAIVERCDVEYWDIVDDVRRERSWNLSNALARTACGIPARREERED